MLGNMQKYCLKKGLQRSIRAIKLGKITDPEQIHYIISLAVDCRHQKIIEDFEEIGTSHTELLALMPETPS